MDSAQRRKQMEEWLSGFLEKQAMKQATVLFQGYPYTGFARLAGGQLSLPNGAGDVLFDKDLYWDIRMFGPEGEWHLWRKDAKGGWGDRFRAANAWQGAIERDYVLWGKRDDAEEGWSCLSEARGATVWVPGGAGDHLALRMKLEVEPDPETGMAGIVDAMICEIVEARKS
jgi:CRISPR-associated protein (TIGR03984 family)